MQKILSDSYKKTCFVRSFPAVNRGISKVIILVWLSVFSAAILAPQPAEAASPAPGAPQQAPAVLTQWGIVRGLESGGTYAYLGIPYSAPPAGNLRWKAPGDPTPWQGELLAQAYPPECPQLDEDGLPTGSEDCLYLNVWAPLSAIPGGSLPVLFFLHGGGNTSGSTSETFSQINSGVPLYDAQLLAEIENVLVVTAQYRLGALGFLAHPAFQGENTHTVAGNFGLLDQIKALEWVQTNIAHFGGDPTSVMLFGESAGALDTCLLLVAPSAAGLFSRALMQSGGCIAASLNKRLAEGLDFAAKVGCDIDPDPAACLRNLPAAELVSAVDTTSIVNGIVHMPFGPTVDGTLVTQEPMSALQAGSFNHTPFVIGTNADEMLPSVPDMTQPAYVAAVHAMLDPFGAGYASQALNLYPVGPGYYPDGRRAFAALTTDAQFTCPARRIARLVEVAQTQPVYRYFFNQPLRFPYDSYGAFHGLELAFLFKHLTYPPFYFPSSQEQALMSAMGGYWSRFASTGNPNGAGAVTWPEYEAASDPYLELKYGISAGQGVRTAKCNFWDTLPTYRIHLPLAIRN